MPAHTINWYFGWNSILIAFVSGAVIGLFFHQPGFLGGYPSFRRRMVRLGHISLAALGMINVLYGISPWPAESLDHSSTVASVSFMMGGVTMPLTCFLTAWKEWFRHAFAIPVISLILAAVSTLQGGPS